MRAYIFVNAASGKPAEVVQQLRRIAGIKAADMCWGVPDIVAVAEAADAKALQVLVLDKIQKLMDVKGTDTHIVCES
ncbi:MAG TPA: Lrp/AsnC ligand binding domain-containing protein [Gemmatimonadales bacterium]|nr:Lrp/AsnC ligand binding domain-containing protein [Gemmatimonadales bacterium]